ncbi:hypothetical protein SVI_2104 [Shewanella violacea DSS12]|uniref:Uncharacterized protein n=1 Tax=Shewanella violacea (strain JCM 10179 / CIP 106290 / LMG 19151 / DSS12) TaxID=637905 RepID=D4ZK76_SHEVD|nr:hypothetical protein SVI_2104 [Shewanella violacea DSS12]
MNSSKNPAVRESYMISKDYRAVLGGHSNMMTRLLYLKMKECLLALSRF